MHRLFRVLGKDEIQDIMHTQKRITKNTIQKDFGITYQYLCLGVDRVDYTKGLVERLKIIDRFLEKYPRYQGKFTYVSIAPLSRQKIPTYKLFYREVLDMIEKINWKYSQEDWMPISFINKTIPREKIFAYCAKADACLVTSLDDGMNLVAKEYVIACNPKKGMLILSKFTGAAKDLTQALLINPYDVDESADALHEALTMKSHEKFQRNMIMRGILKEQNIYKWAIKFIKNTLASNKEDEQIIT
ncbi:trehalose-6-phosphate synthase [Candidatus Roizmanbacteria bacterium]|nr:trehalose-6-phosphate synthase [Candidatus Roizmanbacteria bacterium]